MNIEIEEFKYDDIINSPPGWIESRLENRLREGFKIWQDLSTMSWCGKKVVRQNPKNKLWTQFRKGKNVNR